LRAPPKVIKLLVGSNQIKQDNKTTKPNQTKPNQTKPFEKGYKQIVLPDKRTHSGNTS